MKSRRSASAAPGSVSRTGSLSFRRHHGDITIESCGITFAPIASASSASASQSILSGALALADFDRKTGVCKREGLVTPEMMDDWLRASNVVLKGGGLDESPHCYKRLNEVLAAQGNTVRVLHTLSPLGVAMAGENEHDPFKD